MPTTCWCGSCPTYTKNDCPLKDARNKLVKEDKSPHSGSEAVSAELALLCTINALIDTVRELQYEAERKEEMLGGKFWAGQGSAYDNCAQQLTEIVKSA